MFSANQSIFRTENSILGQENLIIHGNNPGMSRVSELNFTEQPLKHLKLKITINILQKWEDEWRKQITNKLRKIKINTVN